MKLIRAFHGSRSGPRVESGAFPKPTGLVRSGLEMFEISRVGLGRIRRVSNITGQVG